MLVLRDEQLRKLDEAGQRDYHERLRALLRNCFSPLVKHLDDDRLLESISIGVARARGYGIQGGKGILGYVGLALVVGPEFHDAPKVRRFLESSTPGPEEKVQWLFEQVIERLKADRRDGSAR